MKLTEFNRVSTAKQALKESFGVNVDVNNFTRAEATKMLSKVKGLINESRRGPSKHSLQTSPSYMKLVFLEQALTNQLKALGKSRLVVENVEVERSQVILAAQDLVDTVQKMYEDVNDMLVKELPALVNSVQSEIGVNEGKTFSEKANQALSTLNSSLQETKNQLQDAIDIITGNAEDESFGSDEGDDMDLAPDEFEDDMEEFNELPEPEEEGFPKPKGDEEFNPAGRAKRM